MSVQVKDLIATSTVSQVTQRPGPRLPRPVPPDIEGPLTEDERWVVLHLRGHLHHGPSCPLCKAWDRWAAEVRRNKDLEVEMAYAQRTLSSIIEG